MLSTCSSAEALYLDEAGAGMAAASRMRHDDADEVNSSLRKGVQGRTV